jgi:SAM-dependent methyltransferase
MTTLSCPHLDEVAYQEMDASYYLDHTDAAKVGQFRAWFHGSRFGRLGQLVNDFCVPGGRIADLGCGNCLWNDRHLPVIGVDINLGMLEWARQNAYVTEYRVCSDLSSCGLASKSLDIVVMSEVLEHLQALPEVLTEVRRIMKDNAVFLITVPYDFLFSPFFFLFNVHCLYQGYVKGSKYHRQRCGHVNHFSKTGLVRLLTANGFRVTQLFVLNGLTLMAVAQKTSDCAFEMAD